ncbi:hypothetical protein ABEF92_000701 [Exophiala dermatitidis]|uniref:Transglutaminase-like domain-containing protein n=1 Tax=Exophiala dermatitidis (strain ATCC 34100 / CBS 525.76 / NIH/UT8656) TaxID=858893 RepID=H6BLN0_EXODN|nr:uncharacterized protein HMPREF1120_01075 [Exophiala dermatitidis NIH/UT8656]EHY52869.1 hypothetical protein HMPREF1120_01075 [Exophiala dermatitidis NIH/UT8656]
MAEDPQPLTLQQRIAALNAAHIGRIPGDPPRPSSNSSHIVTPAVPARRPIAVKQHTVNNPPERIHGSIVEQHNRVGNLPAPAPPPPVRPAVATRKQPPPLPQRNNSLDEQPQPQQRTSIERTCPKVTATRNKSTESASRVKAPAWGECELPVLPPRGTHAHAQSGNNDRPKHITRTSTTPPMPTRTSTDVRPPPPPQRPALPPRPPSHKNEHDGAPLRKIPPIPSIEAVEKAKKAAFSFTQQHKDHSPSHSQPDAVPGRDRDIVPSVVKVNVQLPMREHRVQEPVVANHEQRENMPFSAMARVAHAFDHDALQHSPMPPPVPLSSRPDLSAIQATKPGPLQRPSTTANGVAFERTNTGAIPSSGSECLICRDFSGPDHQATLFPRTQVTSLQSLAHQLTSPFPSATDKARAIFTWLHHNISYDVVSFFNNNVKGSTPQSTLQSGLAVCEGYAALFTNLATYAGLESLVISGHGKGYGFKPLTPGSPLPPYSASHAWNAVKIDNGEWKLIDACWGAGHVQGAGQPYIRKFSPECFTMSNEEFAVKHFPGNKDHFFLPGGRRMTWEEYIVIDPACWPDMVEGPTIFTNAKEDYSIGEKTVCPRSRRIDVKNNTGMVRFQFGLLCPHWSLAKHTRKGPPPVYIVSVNGVDGRNKDHIPMEYYPGGGNNSGGGGGGHGGGDTWLVDIPARQLGAPGQTLTLFAVTSFGDRQDARGLTVREFREGKGRVGMGFVGVAAWELV